jgi:hypothetical protein
MGWVPMNEEDAGEPEDPEGSERGAVGGEVREWSADGYEPYERLFEGVATRRSRKLVSRRDLVQASIRNWRGLTRKKNPNSRTTPITIIFSTAPNDSTQRAQHASRTAYLTLEPFRLDASKVVIGKREVERRDEQEVGVARVLVVQWTEWGVQRLGLEFGRDGESVALAWESEKRRDTVQR